MLIRFSMLPISAAGILSAREEAAPCVPDPVQDPEYERLQRPNLAEKRRGIARRTSGVTRRCSVVLA